MVPLTPPSAGDSEANHHQLRTSNIRLHRDNCSDALARVIAKTSSSCGKVVTFPQAVSAQNVTEILDEVWTLRPAHVLDEGKMSNLQGEAHPVVHHRCSAFHSCVLRQPNVVGNLHDARLMAKRI